MRLFRDINRPREQGEGLLVFCDMATLACAVIFASGIGSFQGSSTFDAWFLGIWCVIPRCAGRVFGRLQQPTSLLSSFLIALGFLVLIAVLMLLGLELLWFSTPPNTHMLPVTLLSILALWGCGFFLAFPRSYRIWDLLVGSTLLLGTIEAYSSPLPFLVTAVLFWLLSATSRHLVHNVFPIHGLFRDLSTRIPKTLNLQNATVAAVLLGTLATAILTVSYGLLLPWWGTPRAHHRRDLQLAATYTTSQTPTFVDHAPHAKGVANEGEEESDVVGLPIEYATPGPLNLDSLGQSANDRRVAFCVEILETWFRAPWRPDSNTLFRSFVHDFYDAPAQSWVSTREPSVRPWPANGELPLAEGVGETHTVAIQLLHTLRRTLISPGRAISFGPVVRTPPDRSFLDYGDGVVQPLPDLTANTFYVARFVDDPGTLAQLPSNVSASPSPKYLQIPETEEFRSALEKLATQIFDNRTSLNGQARALARWCKTEFLYHRTPQDLGSSSLVDLCERRVGNCVHLSTLSALLLRHQGIATRVATGYLGAEWYENKVLAVVHAHRAHAWIEVWGGDRWYTLDPTEWVEVHPESTLEPTPAAPPPAASELPQDNELASTPSATPPTRGDSTQSNTAPSAPDDPIDGAPQPATAEPNRRRLHGRRETLLQASHRLRDWREARSQHHAELAEAVDDAVPVDSRPTAIRPPSGGSHAVSVDRPMLVPVTARLLLVLLGGAAALLAIRSILRPPPPKRSKKDQEANRDDDAVTLVPLGNIVVEEWSQTLDTPRRQLLYHYHQMQRSLQTVRLHRRPEETPQEHAERLGAEDPAASTDLSTLAHAVTLALYDDQGVNSTDVAEARVVCKRVSRRFR